MVANANRGFVVLRSTGVIISIILFTVIWVMPLPKGLSEQGRQVLAIILMTVVWWMFRILPVIFTTFLMLTAFMIFHLAPASVVFGFWVSPVFWLVFSSFLISGTVVKSGLGKRIALGLLARWVSTYTGFIGSIFLLSLFLSLLIPSPFPRVLLLIAVVKGITDSAGLTKDDKIAVNFAVFVSSTATSMVFYTGDVLLNGATASLSGTAVSWNSWFFYMAVPGVIASILLMLLYLMVFKVKEKQILNRDLLRKEYLALGPMTLREKKSLGWIIVTLGLWILEFLHHINPAWIALGSVVGMASPYIGELITQEDISTEPNWPILLFLAGTLSIGSVANVTGLGLWLAHLMLGSYSFGNPYLMIGIVSGVVLLLHMVLGSALATMSVVVSPIIAYLSPIGWPPIATTFLIYTIVQLHYLLPFHHVTIMLGANQLGGYGERATLKLGLPLTLFVFIIIFGVEIPWWRFTGLIP